MRCVGHPEAAGPFGGWVGRNRYREYRILAGRDRKKEVLSRVSPAARGVELSSHRLSPAGANPPEVTWVAMGDLLQHFVVVLVKANAPVGVDNAESAETAAKILATDVWFARVDQSLKNLNAVVEGLFGDHASQIQPLAADIEGFHFL